jgi:hypothetical protein
MPILRGAIFYTGLTVSCAFTAVSLGVLAGTYWQSFAIGMANRRDGNGHS